MALVLLSFIPLPDSQGLSPFLHAMNVFVVYVFFYCGSVWSTYMTVVVSCWNMWFGGYVAYNQNFGLSEGLECTFVSVFMSFLVTAVASIFEHVSDLY